MKRVHSNIYRFFTTNARYCNTHNNSHSFLFIPLNSSYFIRLIVFLGIVWSLKINKTEKLFDYIFLYCPKLIELFFFYQWLSILPLSLRFSDGKSVNSRHLTLALEGKNTLIFGIRLFKKNRNLFSGKIESPHTTMTMTWTNDGKMTQNTSQANN